MIHEILYDSTNYFYEISFVMFFFAVFSIVIETYKNCHSCQFFTKKNKTLQQFKFIKTGFVVSVLDLMNYHVDSYYIFFKICSNFHNIFYFDEIDLNPKTYVLPKNKWHTTYYFGKNSQNSNFFGHVEV